MIDHSESVVRHYSAAQLTQKIADILSRTLPNDRPLTANDLAPIDQFHTRGIAKAWFRQLAASPPRPGGASLGVAMGADFPELLRNLGRNLAEGRVGTLSAVLERTVMQNEGIARGSNLGEVANYSP